MLLIGRIKDAWHFAILKKRLLKAFDCLVRCGSCPELNSTSLQTGSRGRSCAWRLPCLAKSHIRDCRRRSKKQQRAVKLLESHIYVRKRNGGNSIRHQGRLEPLFYRKEVQ
jgi:hypothetical protein